MSGIVFLSPASTCLLRIAALPDFTAMLRPQTGLLRSLTGIVFVKKFEFAICDRHVAVDKRDIAVGDRCVSFSECNVFLF
jgi:type IV secretory pathway protease TraF